MEPSKTAEPEKPVATLPSSSVPGNPAPDQTKKRKRPFTSKTTTKKKKSKQSTKKAAEDSTLGSSTVASSANHQQQHTKTPPPKSILILDNGGHTVKYGWAAVSSVSPLPSSSVSSPKHMPNMTAKLKHQWTILVGDELTRRNNCPQPSQLESTTRSTERGIVTNLSNQIQVWKRILDDLGVLVPTTTEAAQVFGWKAVAARGGTGGGTSASTSAAASATTATTILPQSCAVLLLVPPHCPRVVLEQVSNIWFQEFHFGHVGFAVAPVMAAANVRPPPLPPLLPVSPASSGSSSSNNTTKYSCMVDMGWSAIHIVPTQCRQQQQVSSTSTTTRTTTVSKSAIRRIPLGGRHLVQLWKYYVSYRQWNLMDQDGLLQDVQEQLGYVSLDFNDELKVARKMPLGRRPYDREFVLPDYSTTYKGFVRLPPALLLLAQESVQQQQQQQQQRRRLSSNNNNNNVANNYTVMAETQDEIAREAASVEEESTNENEDTLDDENGGSNDNDGQLANGQDDMLDDDEESDEAKRRRILKQRQEEERRRQQEEADHQVLTVSVERFAIPEVLFRPTDAGVDPNLAGLPQAIVASISACPRQYQAIMYRSIRIVGGLACLPNLKERLEREIRCLAPCQYEVRVEVVDSPVEQAWLGANSWVQQQKTYSDWSISIDEWEASRKDSKKPKAWHRLLAENGGAVV